MQTSVLCSATQDCLPGAHIPGLCSAATAAMLTDLLAPR